jgi:hypothetical protein
VAARVKFRAVSLRLTERITTPGRRACAGHRAAVTMSAEERDVYDREIRDTVEHYEQ